MIEPNSVPPAFAWIEIDCPGCGIDFDIEPHEIVPDLRLRSEVDARSTRGRQRVRRSCADRRESV